MIKELNKIKIDELDELLIHCNNRKSNIAIRLNRGEYDNEDELIKEYDYITEAIEAIENIEDVDDYNKFFENFPDLY